MFRRRNALKPDGRTMMGNPYTVSVRSAEISTSLKATRFGNSAPSRKVAPKTGFSSVPVSPCVTKDYETGGDCSLGRVELRPGRLNRDLWLTIGDWQRDRHRPREPGCPPPRRGCR